MRLLDNARTASIVVFALTVAADDAQRMTFGVRGNDRVHAICLADAAEILERIPGVVRANDHHRRS